MRAIEEGQRQRERDQFDAAVERSRLLRLALDELSDADCAYLVEALGLGGKPAGKAGPAAPVRRPGGVRRTVQESR